MSKAERWACSPDEASAQCNQLVTVSQACRHQGFETAAGTPPAVPNEERIARAKVRAPACCNIALQPM